MPRKVNGTWMLYLMECYLIHEKIGFGLDKN
jgi:hypothetical protein